MIGLTESNTAASHYLGFFFSNLRAGLTKGPILYRSSRFHAAWNRAALSAIISHTIVVASDRATRESFNLKIATNTPATTTTKKPNTTTRTLMGDHTLH